MSHHPDESGSVPEDRRLIRPYVAPSERPYRATTPAWPHTGPVPVSFRAPDARREDEPGRSAEAAGAAGARAGRRDRGSPLPLVVLLLALGAAGGLVFLLSGPDPRPERAVVPPELSVPALPAGSGGAGDEPSPAGSVRASAPPASAGPSASRTPKRTPRRAPRPDSSRRGLPGRCGWATAGPR